MGEGRESRIPFFSSPRAHEVREACIEPCGMTAAAATRPVCECGAPEHADLVTDVASGDVVCRGCGVVVEAHMFDEHLEFYSDEAGPRAGAPESWLLPARPVVIDRPRRHVLANTDPHASVRELFAVVDGMARTYSRDVKDTAKMLCRDLAQQRTVRSDARHLHAAAALYLAARMHGRGIGRSKREIVEQLGAYGVTERGITATAKLFKDALASAPYARELFADLSADDLINRCVDRLDVDVATRRAVKRTAHALAAIVPAREVEGKTPCSVCSGVVVVALDRLGVRLPKKHLVESCRVSSATMDKMARAVRQWAGDDKDNKENRPPLNA